jgi:toxin ParE1/3/4
MAVAPYKIVYLPVAENDLAEILVYLKARNQTAARNLLAELNKNIGLLAESPYLGSIPRDEAIQKTGHRFMLVDKYLVFYTVSDHTVEIRRILHGARDLRGLLT